MVASDSPGGSPSLRLLRVLFACLSIACVLASCSFTPRDGAGLAVEECLTALVDRPSAVTGVFIEPDDGYAPVVDELDEARCRIDLSIYMLTDDTIFGALADASNRGVDVRVILDEHPFGMFGSQQEAMDRLLEEGIEVKWGVSEHQFAHAKYAVVDERVALIMNQNLTRSAFNGNREFGVVTTDPTVVDQAIAVFASDWNGKSSGNIQGPLIVSPENSRERINDLINGADTSIDFYAEVIRDTGILAALGNAIDRGVSVRLIVNGTQDPEDIEMLIALSESGVQIRLMERMYIHAKTMIIDGDAALIGSLNYTMTSLDRNREVGMVVTDPALVGRVVSVYERDWLRSIPADTVPASGRHDRDRIATRTNPVRMLQPLLTT